MILSMTIATVIRIFLVIISYGCKVPAGIFVPSMAIGAAFGRTLGMLVQALHENSPDARLFASCAPDIPCITPGTYAFLGAAAALSGIMHITVSVVVIMFELTGALTYILPTMIVVGVTKAFGDRFGKGGIADRMITFNGFPFLDTKEEHVFHAPVSEAMNSTLTVLPAAGMSVDELEHILETTPYQGFPICDNGSLLLGYINRSELKYGLERARRQRTIAGSTKCFFTPAAAAINTPRTPGPTLWAGAGGAMSIDFARFVDPTPLTVHPRLPLETVMELFKKVGPRVVLVEHRGRLAGVVTRKDVLKFQYQMENREHMREPDDRDRQREERLWTGIVGVAAWARDKLFAKTPSLSPAGQAAPRRRHSRGVGDEVEVEGLGISEVEMDDRAR